MKLKMQERLMLVSVLPTQGNFLTVALASDLRKKVLPDNTENETLGIKQQAEAIQWDTTKDFGKDFEFEKSEMQMIKKALKELDDSGKLSMNHIELYRIFMVEPDKSAAAST